eukprot:GHVT01101244.1.p2 GENE.GHVT01101244.1~~GHVT01101244.1.p2  ORF type:complete len:128 (-),score=46.12 GHVT01101244.1:1119-1502(-)
MHSPSTSASPFCSSCGSKGVGKLSEEALEEVHAISSIYAADARVRLDGDVVAFAPHQPPAALGPSLEVGWENDWRKKKKKKKKEKEKKRELARPPHKLAHRRSRERSLKKRRHEKEEGRIRKTIRKN